MGLLQPATNNIAYLKAGLFGFQGSGKTYTAVKQAIYLHKHMAKMGLEPGPVAMFDTENGSAFAEPEFSRHKIPFVVFRGRAFQKLIQVANEAIHDGCSILIVDSATHIWRDLVSSYLKKNKRKKLRMHDWGPLKEEWGQFPDIVVNAPIHMFVLGRAGYEYDTADDGDGGYDTIKTGTKMKAEGEFGFEPSIVFEMTRVRLTEDGIDIGKEVGTNRRGKPVRATAKGRAIEKHRAYCVKDRNMDPKTTLDGKFFDFDPAGKESAPFDILKDHLKCLNIGGVGVGLDTSDSQEMLDSPDHSYIQRKRECAVLGEKIKETLILAELEGRTDAIKKKRTEALIAAFGTSSWTEITENIHPAELAKRLSDLRINLLGEDPEQIPELGDEPQDQIPF